MLPALAIVVALWFERVAEALDRRCGDRLGRSRSRSSSACSASRSRCSSTRTISRARRRSSVRKSKILGALMLVGSLATVAAIATRDWNWLAPYVLGATSGALVLFIALDRRTRGRSAQADSAAGRNDRGAACARASVVGVRGVAGTYALIFYTAPGVVTLEEDNSDFRSSICRDRRPLSRHARGRRAGPRAALTAAQGRRSTEIGRRRNVALLHIDGPRCAEGSGGPT